MSLFATSNLKKMISGLGNMLGGAKKATRKTEKLAKRLAVDTLEDRIMLSVSPTTWYDVRVNTSISDYQSTETNGSALAANNDGDMVAVWTRGDYVLIANENSEKYYLPGYYIDRSGTQIVQRAGETEAEYKSRLKSTAAAYYIEQYDTTIDVRLIDIDTGGYIDPETGAVMIDYNIYARYLTDEVQRITLPVDVVQNADGSAKAGVGRLSLTLGGSCQQKITFNSTPITPYGDGMTNANINLTQVRFSFGGQFTDFHYIESLGAAENARLLQIALQDLGANAGSALANAQVTATNPREFTVEFGPAGVAQELITAEIVSLSVNATFLPSVDIEMVRNAFTISNIAVHPTDPAITAAQIKTQIELFRQYYGTGPVFFPSPDQISLTIGPAQMPLMIRAAVPEVNVVPVQGVTVNGEAVLAFDITFVNSSGKQDQPLVIVSSVMDSQKNEYTASPEVTVTTIKECSPEFQVNEFEGYDPYSGLPLFKAQFAPSVAMDADGEFVITWTSDADPSKTPGSTSDVYARRYQPQSWKNPTGQSADFVQSVKALGDSFRVNSFTTNAQWQSDVAIDEDGNFVIVWAQTGQEVSYFNGIYAQRFNSDGVAVGSTFRVDRELTGEAVYPTVAMNDDGYFGIAWVWVDNAQAAMNTYYRMGIEEQQGALSPGAVYYSIYEPEGNTLLLGTDDAGSPGFNNGDNGIYLFDMPQALGGWAPSIDFTTGYVVDDAQVYRTYYAISVCATKDTDTHLGVTTTGVYAKMYGIDRPISGDGFGDATRTVILDEFRVNSASFDITSDTLWCGGQYDGKIGMDADGDFVVAYYGYGPDTNENIWPRNPTALQRAQYMSLFAKEISATKNADLRAFFNPVADAEYAADYFETFTYGPLDPAGPDEDGYYVVLYGADGLVKARSNGDVDSMINGIMAYAQSVGASDEQLGRLRTALNKVFRSLRGEANGVMFTMLDALKNTDQYVPGIGGTTILSSDNVGNATRDGANSMYYLYFDHSPWRVWTQMTMRVGTPWGAVDVTFNPVYDMNDDGTYVMTANGQYVLIVNETAEAIEKALANALCTGYMWPEAYDYDGPVEVRWVMPAEIQLRQGTEWRLYPEATGIEAYDVIFEIQFQGDVHDTDVALAQRRGTVLLVEEQRLVFPTRGGNITPGYIGISIGGNTTGQGLQIYISDQMIINPNDAGWTTLATTIAQLLGGWGYANVTVEHEYDPLTGEHSYSVFFPANIGEDIPMIEFHWEFNNGRGGENQPELFPEYRFARATEVTKGRTLNNVYYDIDEFVIGNSGTDQAYVNIAMTPDGDFGLLWTQYEQYTRGYYTESTAYLANTNIFHRVFKESTDTAGPRVTGIATLDGKLISEGKQISSSDFGDSNTIVVTFDEEMRNYDNIRKDQAASVLARYWEQSVTNPANWALLFDGVEISGAIEKITFGNNESMNYTGEGGSNKWEAVITFNSAIVDVDMLKDGAYTLIARNSMTDVNGNPLGRTGFEPNGDDWQRDFYLFTADKTPSLVNDPNDPLITGDVPVPVDGYFAEVSNNNNTNWSPTAIASSHEGDTVTVWTSFYRDAAGNILKDSYGNTIYDIYARIDYMKWSSEDGDRSTDEQGSKVIRVTDQIDQYNAAIKAGQKFRATKVEFASVALSGTGIDIYREDGFYGTTDFVVTWSQKDLTSAGKDDWNVYARLYSLNGQPKSVLINEKADSNAFRVNDETAGTQRYSSVAMSPAGDFVITWQSNGNKQDDSGYGVFAKRYNALGLSVGGESEVQSLNFSGTAIGTFTLRLYDNTAPNGSYYETDSIYFDGNVYNLMKGFTLPNGTKQASLAKILNNMALKITDKTSIAYGIQYDVESGSLGSLKITSKGNAAKIDLPQLTVHYGADMVLGAGSSVYVTTLQEGVTAEFLVNETTENNQMYASVAMDYSGNFVISWTSYGQKVAGISKDNAASSDIYARYFSSNEKLYGEALESGLIQTDVNYNIDIGTANPDTYLADRLETGVCRITANGGTGTGTMLMSGKHILTAAHVVAGLTAEQIGVFFTDAEGTTVEGVTVLNVTVHPGWVYGYCENDIAIIELADRIPESRISRYDIQRTGNEIGKEFTVYGYGQTGNGTTGPIDMNTDFHKYYGTNAFDGTLGQLNAYNPLLYVGDKVLIADYDDGTAANDSLGRAGVRTDTGTGPMEVCPTEGDSGGPAFIKLGNTSVIAGVVSAAITLGPEIHPVNDYMYGQVSTYTRVSSFADWIDATLAGAGGGGEFLVNRTDEGSTVDSSVFTDGIQKWSDVAIDASGDFVITWTSSATNSYLSQEMNDVYARRFTYNSLYLSGEVAAVADPFRVNTTTEGNQQLSKVAMDADGDFVIVWEDHISSSQPNDGVIIMAQRYFATEKLNALSKPNGANGNEFQVGEPQGGQQHFPAVAVSAAGDIFTAWQDTTGTGINTKGQVYSLNFYQTVDKTAPIVAAVFIEYIGTDGETYFAQVRKDNQVDGQILRYLVVFDEQMMGQNANENRSNSVTSLSNWSLRLGAETKYGAIESVTLFNSTDLTDGYKSGDATNVDEHYPTGVSQKNAFWVTLNADVIQDMISGAYTLVLKGRVEDIFGNNLDSNLDGKADNDDYTIRLEVSNPEADRKAGKDNEQTGETVNTKQAGDQSDPAIATDEKGNYIVVWTKAIYADPTTVPEFKSGADASIGTQIWGRYYNSNGQPQGDEFVISDSPGIYHKDPSVAMSASGTFVVTWTDTGVDTNQNGIADPQELLTENVYFRVFETWNVPLTGELPVTKRIVNTDNGGKHHLSSVAMDASGGSFVVVWANDDNVTTGNVADRNGIWYQYYNINGYTVKTVGVNEVVNVPDKYIQTNPSVACDANGNFTVAWQGMAAGVSSYNVYARQFVKSGTGTTAKFTSGSTFQVNTQHYSNMQSNPSISMDVNGYFIIGWQSYLTPGDGNEYGIVHKVYAPNGKALTGEVQTNVTVFKSQISPSVGLKRFYTETEEAKLEANPADVHLYYYISWTSYRQEQRVYNEDGVYGQYFTYTLGQSDPVGTGEESLNLYQRWDENQTAAMVDIYGNRRVVWTGPDSESQENNEDGSLKVAPAGSKPYTDIYQIGKQLTKTTTTGTNYTVSYTSSGSVAYKSIPVSSGTATPVLNVGGTGSVTSTSTTQTIVVDANTRNEFSFTATNGKPTLVLNGTTLAVNDGVTKFVVNASSIGSGYISAIVKGLGQVGDSVEVSGSDIIIKSGGYQLTLKNCTDVQFDGLGSAAATIKTSGNGDAVTASGQNVSMRLADGRTVTLHGCSSVTATGAAGDVINLTGTTGVDTLNISHTSTVMTGENYSITAKSFGLQNIHGYNNNDTAVLKNNAAKATLDMVGYALTYSFTGSTINLSGFANVDVQATGTNMVTANITTVAGDAVRTDGSAVTITNETRGFTRKLTGMQNVNMTSGGDDTVILVGTLSNDTLTATPVETTFSGTNFKHTLKGFADITVIGMGGGDTANLYDSVGDDTFTAKPDSAVLTGTYIDTQTGKERVYRVEVQGFGTVKAHATAGGNDTALLYDSAGNDTYTAYGDYATMVGTGFSNAAYGFGTIQAFSTGGTDTANFVGTAGDDEFILKPNFGKMLVTDAKGNQKINTATGFANINVDGQGGNDQVSAYDSVGDDVFTLSPGKLEASGNGFRYTAKNVETINVNHTEGGNDTLTASGSSAAETVILRPKSMTMVSANGYVTTATGFSRMEVSGGNDTKDVVLLYDSRGNDVLTSWFDESSLNIMNITTMEGDGFFNQVSGFKNIKAYSTAGGEDTAIILDSSRADVYDYVNGTLLANTADYNVSRSLINFDHMTVIRTKSSKADTRTEAAKAADIVFEGNWD